MTGPVAARRTLVNSADQDDPRPSPLDTASLDARPLAVPPRGDGVADRHGPPLSMRRGGAGIAEGPHERLILEGPDRLSTVDLLTVLLGRRGRARRAGDAAWRLLERFRSLRRIAGATIGELDGLGPVSTAGAARLVAAFALARRAYSRRIERGEPFRSSLEIYERYASLLRDARKERFFVVLLDGKGRVTREELVSEGSLTSSLAHPREVFSTAMREAAASIVLVHNHPSGDPEPSPDDIEVTKRLVSVGELVGIRVVDHVIIGDERYVSLLDRGWVPR